jgi:hypothetical protein
MLPSEELLHELDRVLESGELSGLTPFLCLHAVAEYFRR